jgi:outer membrane protein TolC
MKTMKLVLLISALLLFSFSGIPRAEESSVNVPVSIDQEEAISLALQNNKLIQAAQRMVEAAIADGRSQFANFLPKLSTTYSYTRLDKAPTTTFDLGEGPETIPVGTADNYEWKFDLVVPIYTGGATPVAKRMIGINRDTKINTLETARLGISYGVTEAYYGVMSSNLLVNVQKDTLDYLTSAHDNALKWQEEGYFLPTEPLQIEVAKGKSEIALREARDMNNTALRTLKQILGLDGNVNLEIVEPDSAPAFRQVDKNKYMDIVEKNNLDIQAIDLQIKMLREQKKLVLSQKKPSLSLVAGYSNTGDDPMVSGNDLGSDPNSFAATLLLSWSIYDSDKVKQGAKNLQESIMALELQRTDTFEKTMIDAETTLNDYLRAIDKIAVTAKNLEAAKENFRILNSRFNEGLETSTKILEGQSMLSGAKLEYYQSIFDSHKALTKLAIKAGFETTSAFLESIESGIDQSVGNNAGDMR